MNILKSNSVQHNFVIAYVRVSQTGEFHLGGNLTFKSGIGSYHNASQKINEN